MKIADIAKVIEAVLLVSGDGVDKDEFKRIYDLSDKELNKCLDILKQKYNEDSGINIITYKNKIQLCSNPALAENVAEILNPIRERSLTKSALETIAIIAYKQPITRSEIEQIRNANSDYAMQLLQSNNLIEVVGRKDTVGKPLLFGTTDNFLKRFGLESLDLLPNHKELLDRIQVIHSEGDSLYREFDIPTEENNENADSQVNNEENVDGNEEQMANTETSTVVGETAENKQNEEIKQTENQTVKKSKKSKPSVTDIKVDNNESRVIEESGPKLSWRDKMKAKMTENSEHYENLDSVLEKKK